MKAEKSKIVNCQLCNQEFRDSLSRISRGAAKHCSRECADKNRPPILSKKIELNCLVCGGKFFVKPSRLKNAKFCSKKCHGIQQTSEETEERNCLFCGVLFRATKFKLKKGYAKFCSDKCRLKKPKTGINKKCETCEKEIYVNLFKLEIGQGKYCSRECKNVANRTSINRNCQTCNRIFPVCPARIKNGGGIFCSDECYYHKRLTGKYICCVNCGSEFYATAGKIKNNKNSFCSRKCASEWRVGPNSPAWRGGVTPENKKIRDSLEYKNWRDSVFQRDCYTCQECGDRSGNGHAVKLEAHHIKSFSEFPELIFETENGQTLCRDCHKKTDSWGRPHKDRIKKYEKNN